ETDGKVASADHALVRSESGTTVHPVSFRTPSTESQQADHGRRTTSQLDAILQSRREEQELRAMAADPFRSYDEPESSDHATRRPVAARESSRRAGGTAPFSQE